MTRTFSRTTVRWVRVATGVGVAMVCVGCAPATDPDSSSGLGVWWEKADEVVAEVAEEVACEEPLFFAGDISFSDQMRGVSCLDDPAHPWHFRIYADPDSPAQVLTDWAGVFTPDYLLLPGPNWFAVGSDSVLAAVAHVTGSPDAPTTAPLPGRPLTPVQDELVTCIRFVFSGAESLVQDGDIDDSIRSLEQLYPGVVSQIQTLATGVTMPPEGGERAIMTVQAELSTKHDAVVRFCEDHLTRNP
jgi:hypothetical protein